MKVLNPPSFATIREALDYADTLGDVFQVYLRRGPDGLIRGTAWLRLDGAE